MQEPDLPYGGAHLDRAANRRDEPDWLAARARDPATRIVPVHGDCGLISDDTTDAVRVDYRADRLTGLLPADELVFLGMDGQHPVFAADVTDRPGTEVAAAVGGASLRPLRQIGGVLPAAAVHRLAYARSLLHWHRNHRYCGRCGASAASERGGHLRRCRNTACDRLHYPRTDPAVIMLVTLPPAPGRSAACLLAHHGRFPPGVFSTLAGYVEPGENLEEAVVREVAEEVGVPVGEVRYQASQPWPFPGQLMVGFHAVAAAESLTPDGVEVETARWFNADEVAAAGEWGDAGDGLKLPRRDSIARLLIERWLGRASGH